MWHRFCDKSKPSSSGNGCERSLDFASGRVIVTHDMIYFERKADATIVALTARNVRSRRCPAWQDVTLRNGEKEYVCRPLKIGRIRQSRPGLADR